MKNSTSSAHSVSGKSAHSVSFNPDVRGKRYDPNTPSLKFSFRKPERKAVVALLAAASNSFPSQHEDDEVSEPINFLRAYEDNKDNTSRATSGSYAPSSRTSSFYTELADEANSLEEQRLNQEVNQSIEDKCRTISSSLYPVSTEEYEFLYALMRFNAYLQSRSRAQAYSSVKRKNAPENSITEIRNKRLQILEKEHAALDAWLEKIQPLELINSVIQISKQCYSNPLKQNLFKQYLYNCIARIKLVTLFTSINELLTLGINIDNARKAFEILLNKCRRIANTQYPRHKLLALIFQYFLVSYYLKHHRRLSDETSILQNVPPTSWKQLFEERIQAIVKNLPETNELWQIWYVLLANNMETLYTTMLNQSSDLAAFPTAYIIPTENYGHNQISIAQKFLETIQNDISPWYLKTIDNQVQFKTRDDLKNNLVLLKWTKFAEWIAYAISFSTWVSLILMVSNVTHLWLRSTLANYLSLIAFGTLFLAAGLAHRKYYRIVPQQDIEKTLELFSKSNGSQLYPPPPLTQTAVINPLNSLEEGTSSQSRTISI